MKLIKLFSGFMVLTALLTGCGASGQSGESTKTETVAAKTTEGESARVIEHAMGTTEIKGTPLRVVTLFQGATDSALLLGVPLLEQWNPGRKSRFTNT